MKLYSEKRTLFENGIEIVRPKLHGPALVTVVGEVTCGRHSDFLRNNL